MTTINVSIIIPVYNVEKYLEMTLKSAVNQKFSSYEVIIINDGSTDNSESIIREFSLEYSNVIVITQENKGQSAARNAGLEIAKGKYIYFLDSDDYIELNTLEKLFEYSEAENLDLLMFNGTTFSEKNYEEFLNENHYIKSKTSENVMTGTDKFKELILNNEYNCSPCLIFIKKEVLIKNHLMFYEGIIHEDELFMFQLILTCERVKVIRDIYFHRRIRANSTVTSNNHLKSFNGIYRVLIEIMDIEMKNKKYTSEVRNAIRTLISVKYGSALFHYTNLSSKDKKNIKVKVAKLKQYGKSYSYFNKLQYKIFGLSTNIYVLFRKTYHSLVKKFKITK